MMLAAAELKSFVREARAVVARDREVAAFEIYASSAEHQIARLNYTSDLTCRGVEEIKSLTAEGFQVRLQKRRNQREVGAAFTAGTFTMDAVRQTLRRAHRATVIDPHFPGFPAEPRKLAARKGEAVDLMRAGDELLAEAAWEIVRGAAGTFWRSDAAGRGHAGFVLGGDITIIRDRTAIGGSGFADVRVDQDAHFRSSVTALVESLDAKGTASAVGRSATAMRRAGARLGREAVRRSLELGSGVRPTPGEYPVVLGPQPVAEILNYVVMGSLTTGAFYAANSAYHGRFGERVMDERLSLYDEPHMRRGALARRVTCEGLPAARIELVRDGRLTGLLSDFYDTHRLSTDERRAEKLGPSAEGRNFFPPLSGYRLGEGGGRRFDRHLAPVGTNVVMRARGGVAEKELLRAVGDGLYVGRIWYTYPINGQRAGDFTCTVTGDSLLIQGGKLGAPVAPNSLRINSNIDKIFGAVRAVGNRTHPAFVWGAPEVFYVPALAIGAIALELAGDRC